MKMLKTDETLDRLSELHESLIFLILSFLPMRDVVRTTLLSKRWKDLWLSIPYLNFPKHTAHSRDFINRTLMLWKGPEIKKLKFSFNKGSFDASLFADMDLWLRYAIDRKVEELHLGIPCENRKPAENYPVYQLPQSLYSCSSIKKITIYRCDIRIRGNVHWPRLNWLTLYGFGFTEDAIDKIVSSCPQLETFRLHLFGRHQNLSFRSTSLKWLSLYTSEYQPCVLTICTPNLEFLAISGAPFSECLLMDVSSVTRLILNFVDDWFVVLDETMTQIIPALNCAEKISLSASCYKSLVVMKDKYVIPPLMDVKLLKFTCGPIKLNEIVGLLEIFPKLETLVIQRECDTSHVERQEEVTVQSFNCSESIIDMLKPFLMHMKRVDIVWLVYEASMFQFIELMLKHATMMEKIVIQKSGEELITSEDMFLVAQKLVSLQKSFPTVEIILRK